MPPAPERGARTPWSTFLAAHWEALAAADLFTVEFLTLRGLVRYHALFAIELATRKIGAPHGPWIRKIARSLTDACEGFLRDKRFLILDRDLLFTPAFRRHLAEAGCERLPADRSKDADAERCVGSLRRECLDRIAPLGERHLRHALNESVALRHRERCYPGLDSLIEPDETAGRERGRIVSRTRLGGVLRHSYRRAA